MAKEIKLTQGKVAIVDDADFKYLNQFKWYYCQGYAVRDDTLENGKKIKILMHREVLQPKHELHTDHINQDKLDNRRSNLRECTPAQNNMNRGVQKNNTSGFKGVSWHKTNKKWYARIRIDRRRKHLGCFVSKEAAAVTYNNAALIYHGEFACLNNL